MDGRDLDAGDPRARRFRADAWDRAVADAARLGHPSVHVRARTATGVRELDLRISPLRPARVLARRRGQPGRRPALRRQRAHRAGGEPARAPLAHLRQDHALRRALPADALRLPHHAALRAALPPGLRSPADGLLRAAAAAARRRRDAAAPPLDRGRPRRVRARPRAGDDRRAPRGRHHGPPALGVHGALRGLALVLRGHLPRPLRARPRRSSRHPARAPRGDGAGAPHHRRRVLPRRSLASGARPPASSPSRRWRSPRSPASSPSSATTCGGAARCSRACWCAVVIVASTCAAAVALGTGVAACFDVDLAGALLASSVAGTVAGLLVAPALRFGDEALFPSRAVYKPTIEQLSEELTAHRRPRGGRPRRRAHRAALAALRASSSSRRRSAAATAGRRSAPAASARSRCARRRLGPPPADPRGEGDELSLDVLFRGVPLAVLRVGKKRGGALFTSEDVDLLQTIANQAALALAHAYSYAELEQRAAAAGGGVARRARGAGGDGRRRDRPRDPLPHQLLPLHLPPRARPPRSSTPRTSTSAATRWSAWSASSPACAASPRTAWSAAASPSRSWCLKAERLLRDQLGERALEVELGGAAGPPLRPDQVTQVLVNLLSNALDAAGPIAAWRASREGRVGATFTARQGARAHRVGHAARASRATPRACSRPGTRPSRGAPASAWPSPTASCALTAGPSSPRAATGGRSSSIEIPASDIAVGASEAATRPPEAIEGWR